MFQTVVKMADKFVKVDDYEPGDVYAQYIRMQRKLRNWLYNCEAIKPWYPVLPDEWFEDMYFMTKAYAKDYKNQHMPLLNLKKEDLPRGVEFNVPADRDPEIISRAYGEITTTNPKLEKRRAEDARERQD